MQNRQADEALLRFLTSHGVMEPWMREVVGEHLRARGGSAVEALCDGGLMDEVAIVEVFQKALRVPRAALEGRTVGLKLPLEIEILKSHLVIPIEDGVEGIVLAMVNPLDVDAIRKVRFASGKAVVARVALLSEVRAALDIAGADAGDLRQIDPAEALAQAEAIAAEPASGSPIVKMAAMLITQGAAAHASDIHLEPSADGLVVRYRIDGMLQEVTRLSKPVRTPLIARLKVMAQMDIAERRVPQDGRIAFSTGSRQLDCRVSALPTQYGEKVVIRLLDPKSALVALDQMGFEAHERVLVEECLHQSAGMILTTGPTGSGKSTTLYAMLRWLQTPEINIVTVEDPIEYRLPGITQTEVNQRQGLTFAGALRSILRQDPDVVLVGEIRDRETAEIAIQAAQTGHLVLSTLHTNDSLGAITRLAKLGIDRELIASTLLLVIAQRLVRKVCSSCRERVSPNTWNRLPLRQLLGDGELVRGRGCTECHQTGYRGRSGVYEIFRNTVEGKRLIDEGASEVDLRDLLRSQGGRTLMEVGIEKIRAGQTTPDEVARTIKPDEGASVASTAAEKEAAPPERASATTITMTAAKTVSTPTFLGAGVRAFCAAARLDEIAAGQIELAVVEACTLACGSGDHTAEIRVTAELSPEGHSVCIIDNGPPWPWPRPSATVPDLAAFTEAESAEVHAFLIRSSVDEVSYERTDGTNRLWLLKRPLLTVEDQMDSTRL